MQTSIIYTQFGKYLRVFVFRTRMYVFLENTEQKTL